MISKTKRLIALAVAILTLGTALLSTFAFSAFASDEGGAEPTETVKATIMEAKGGANAIATMTFDDGKVKTARKLNELLAKYGGRASLMLIPGTNMNSEANIELWREILAEGYLSAESHSWSHDYLDNKEDTQQYYTEENINRQVVDSVEFLREHYPDQDVLAMTVPYGWYATEAFALVRQTYYASLRLACVLTESSCIGKMQSLNPSLGTAAGSWYNPYYARLEPYSNANIKIEDILAYLDKCVQQKGWFITSGHGMYQGENQNYTEEDMEILLSAMQQYQEKGQLWVATYSEAVKYIRERQNTAASAYRSGDKYYVRVDWTRTVTEDGLPLDLTIDMPDGSKREVFNMPLTVKLELPLDCMRVSYVKDGQTVTEKTMSDGTSNYVYVDIAPGESAEVTDVTEDSERPGFVPGSFDEAKANVPAAFLAENISKTLETEYKISFVTFASEADFLSGDKNKIIAWYTADEAAKTAGSPNYAAGTTENNIGLGAMSVGYVHFYSDVVNSPDGADVDTGDKRLTVNLAGHTWICAKKFVELSSSGPHPKLYLVVKNGKIDHDATGMYLRQDTTVIFDNVIYDASDIKGKVASDLGCELFMFKDSIVRISEKGQFKLSDNRSGALQGYVIFKNTDLICDGNPTTALFELNNTAYGYIRHKIIFDKDSSIQRNSNNWIKLIQYAPTAQSSGSQAGKYLVRGFYDVQGLYFEVGCEISEAAMPTYNMAYEYTYYYDNRDKDVYLDSKIETSTTKTLYANTDGSIVEVAVVEPSNIGYTLPDASTIMTLTGTPLYDPSNTAPTYKMFSQSDFDAKVASGVYLSDTAWGLKTGDGLAKIMRSEDLIWKPTEDITYAVWESESDYLMGKSPLYTSTELNLDTALVATLGNGVTYKTEGKIPGYVHLYTNLENKTEQIVIGNNQNLVINLNRYTVESNKGISVGGAYASYPNASVTVKNGYFNILDGQLTPRPDTKVFFEDVNFTVTSGRIDAMVYDGGAALIRYTDCTISLKNSVAGWYLTAEGRIEFINTTVSQTGTRTAPLFWFTRGTEKKTITFDKDSSVLGAVGNYVGIKSDVASALSVSLFFEEGIEFSRDAIPTFSYTLSATATEAGTVMNTDDTCEIAILSSDGAVKYFDSYYVLKNNNWIASPILAGYYAVEYGPNEPKFILTAWDTNVISTASAGAALNTKNGSVIKLLDDVEVQYMGTKSDYDLSFDLNGHKLSRIGSFSDFELGSACSGSWMPDRDIRFFSSVDGGELYLTGVNSAFQARPGTNVYFEGIKITVKGNLFNDGGAKTIHLKNCTLTSLSGGYIVSTSGLGAATFTPFETRNLIIENTELKNIGFARIYRRVTDTDFNVIVKGGSVVDNSVSELIKMADDAGYANPSSGFYQRDIYFDIDTKFTVASLDGFVDIAPEASVFHGVKINWCQGDKTVSLDNYELKEGGTLGDFHAGAKYYALRSKVSVGSALQVNITLSSNFMLNFYADKNVIRGIYIGNTALTAKEWEGKDVYSIPFMAHEAADKISFTVIAFLEGEEYELNLDYCILTYASKLLQSDYSEDSKLLAKSAIAYVKEAYKYANREVDNYTLPTDLASFSTEGVTTVRAEGTIEHLTSAVYSINLSLTEEIRIFLHLNTAFTGRVTVDGVTHNVVNGLVDGISGANIIAIGDKRAKELYTSEFTVIAQQDGKEEEVASFKLADYIADDNSDCRPLLDALYTYTYFATDYADRYPDHENPGEGPDDPNQGGSDTPDVPDIPDVPEQDDKDEGKWDLPWDI